MDGEMSVSDGKASTSGGSFSSPEHSPAPTEACKWADYHVVLKLCRTRRLADQRCTVSLREASRPCMHGDLQTTIRPGVTAGRVVDDESPADLRRYKTIHSFPEARSTFSPEARRRGTEEPAITLRSIARQLLSKAVRLQQHAAQMSWSSRGRSNRSISQQPT